MRFTVRLVGIGCALLAPVLASSALATTCVLQPSSQDAFIQQEPNRIAGAAVNNTRVRIMSSPPIPQAACDFFAARLGRTR